MGPQEAPGEHTWRQGQAVDTEQVGDVVQGTSHAGGVQRSLDSTKAQICKALLFIKQHHEVEDQLTTYFFYSAGYG